MFPCFVFKKLTIPNHFVMTEANSKQINNMKNKHSFEMLP